MAVQRTFGAARFRELVEAYLVRNKMKLKEFAQKCVVDERGLETAMSGETTPQDGKLAKVARVLDVDAKEFYYFPADLDIEVRGREDAQRWTGTKDFVVASVIYSMRLVSLALAFPDLVGKIKQSLSPEFGLVEERAGDRKIGKDDKPHVLDIIASSAILKALKYYSELLVGPLADGFLVFCEEAGYVDWFKSKMADSLLWLIIDPLDDTALALRQLGGTCLVTAYYAGPRGGIAFVVAGDPIRKDIYWRVAGGATHAGRIKLFKKGESPFSIPTIPELDFSSLTYGERDLLPLVTTDLAGIALNVYDSNSKRRDPEFAKRYARLYKAIGKATVLSFGGSRGPIMTCTGEFNASVELMGFRPIDALPGLFLADGVPPLTVIRPGAPDARIAFTRNDRFEKIILESISDGWKPEKFDDLRTDYVVATAGLAEKIASLCD